MADNGNTLDLTDMATVDAEALRRALDTYELIVAHRPNGDRRILKGDDVLQSIIASGVSPELAVLNLRVANDEQIHVIAAALQLIGEGKMDTRASLSLWSMLASASQISAVASRQPPPIKSPSVKTATSYPDAATRGQLRLWKQKLARRYQRFERGYRGDAASQTKAVLDAFIHKTGVGRRRAFDKLGRALGAGVTLEGLRLDGSAPLAVWSILKPRDSVRIAHDDDTPIGPDCVTVDYVLGGVLPGPLGGSMGGVCEGLWTLEINDHALGRVLVRSGGEVALEAVIAEAHHNVLQLRTATVLPVNDLSRALQFLVRAGGGGFICEFSTGPDVSMNNARGVYVRALTWITDDMKHDDQVLLVPDGAPGERLIDSWLLPMPVRRIIPSGGAFVCASWVEGLPDLLAAPKGLA